MNQASLNFFLWIKIIINYFFKNLQLITKKETMLVQEIIIVLKIISFFITRLVYFTQKGPKLTFNLVYKIVIWVICLWKIFYFIYKNYEEKRKEKFTIYFFFQGGNKIKLWRPKGGGFNIYVTNQTRGRKVSKTLKKSWTSFMEDPLLKVSPF